MSSLPDKMPALTMRGVLDETGLSSVIRSPFDVKLLYLQRFVRMFAFGAASLILALYLEELGYTDQVTGLFMALTMLGDVAISFLLTLFADGLGRRNVLVAGSALVAVCGVVFATSSSYWALLAVCCPNLSHLLLCCICLKACPISLLQNHRKTLILYTDMPVLGGHFRSH